MRRPTAKELHVLNNCMLGLEGDITGLHCTDERLREDGVTYADVLGTLRANLQTMTVICKRLTDEPEPTR